MRRAWAIGILAAAVLAACGPERRSDGGPAAGGAEPDGPAGGEGASEGQGERVGEGEGEGEAPLDEEPARPPCDADREGEPLTLPMALRDGPYGTNPFDLAGPFTFPSDRGDWRFEEHYDGRDSYLFVAYYAGVDLARGVWESDLAALLAASPRNVHYFFVVYPGPEPSDTFEAPIAALRERVDGVLDGLSDADREHWTDRIHLADRSVRQFTGWIGEMVRVGRFWFAIDRFQRRREVGALGFPGPGFTPEIRYLAYEAQRFDFEIEQAMAEARRPGVTTKVFEGERAAGPIETTVDLPALGNDAGADRSADALWVDLHLGCPGRLDERCPGWDAGVSLRVCDGPDGGECGAEIARWITAYKRSGRWVTDISPQLALLPREGPVRLRLEPGGVSEETPYIVDLSLTRAVTCATGDAPFDDMPLWEGGAFGPEYNGLHEPIDFTLPEGTQRVELVLLLTGHGWGAEIDNCADFCNHTHHFSVAPEEGDGREWVIEHPDANSRFGCADRVGDGVVPNQYGTWPFGRGGWCPGLDVAPHVIDITEAVEWDQTNTIEYRALFEGEEYVPRANPGDPGGFGAVIDLDSRLVFYR